MRFECRITDATDAHSEYVILLFRGNSGDANAPHCYVLRTPPLFWLYNSLYYRPNSVGVSLTLFLSTEVDPVPNTSCSNSHYKPYTMKEAMAPEVMYRDQSHTELYYVCLTPAASRLSVGKLE
jgi:hypothetical protein